MFISTLKNLARKGLNANDYTVSKVHRANMAPIICTHQLLFENLNLKVDHQTANGNDDDIDDYGDHDNNDHVNGILRKDKVTNLYQHVYASFDT